MRPSPRSVSWRALALAAALVLAGCADIESPAVAPSAGANPSPSSTSVPRPAATPEPVLTPTPAPPAGTKVAQARRQLAQLGVKPRPGRPPDYDRDLFGPRWEDVDGNGCNQRDDVLRRDASTVRVQRQGACDHDVVAGRWRDPYTGAVLRFTDLKDPGQAQAIQIDHVVPLAEAWVSGARAWSPGRRLAFANHLPGLLAVDGPTNASKGSSDPAAWRPRKGYQCTYAVRWIAIKHRWRLVVDPSEVRALKEMLEFC